MKRALHTYKGLNTDLARDTISKGFYIDALDIRLTTDVGESNGSITNIKGNVNYFSLPTNDPDFPMEGTMEIIGATSIRDTIIIYCADDSDTNGWIFKLTYSNIDQTLSPPPPAQNPIIIYKHSELKFSKKHPIEAQGRFETGAEKRVYWSDYNNYFRSLNIESSALLLPYGDINYPSVGTIDIFPDIEYTQPILDNIFSGGALQTGVYQYSYRVMTEDGKQSLVSPPGNMIHVINDSENDPVTRFYNGNNSFSGSTPQITNKAVRIKIDVTEYVNVFDSVELICALYTDLNSAPEIFSIETIGIENGSTEIFITHTGQEDSIISLDINEFTIRTLPFKTPKTLTPKDGSLIVANIKGSSFSVKDLLGNSETFEVKTARHNPAQDVVVPTLGNETAEEIEQIKLKNAFNVIGTNAVGYNQDAHWEKNWHLTVNQYKFQSDGARLGGTGPNINYHFHLEPIKIDNTNAARFTSMNHDTNVVALDDSYGNYNNNSFGNHASPYNSGLIRGYKRGETYRFGIVFYDKKGNSSFVEYIGDIKFPDISELDSTVNASGTKYFPLSVETSADNSTAPEPSYVNTTAYNLGVKFTLDFSSCPILQSKIDSYQIVRVKRGIEDSKRMCSGIMKVAANISVGSTVDHEDAYDLNSPTGQADILHLQNHHRPYNDPPNKTVQTPNKGLGKNGNFATINNNRIASAPWLIYGAAIHFASPDITYDFPGIRQAIGTGACILMTGAYGQYFSSTAAASKSAFASSPYTFTANTVVETNGAGNIRKSFDYVENRNTDDNEELGNVEDQVRKLRTVNRVKNGGGSSANALIALEYVKQFIGTGFIEYTSNRQDNSDMITNLSKGIGPYEVRGDTGATGTPWYFRNFFATIPNDEVGLNDHKAGSVSSNYVDIDTSWSQGATGLLASMKFIATDPLTNQAVTAASTYNAFNTGTGTSYTPVGVDQVTNPVVAYPINKGSVNENLTSTPILDILIPRSEVYGGFTQSALENNVFMTASPVIPVTTLSPEVFGGDIFLNMFTFQESTAWLWADEPQAFYQNAVSQGDTKQEFSTNRSSTITMVTESRVNIELAWGATTKTDVKFDVGGGGSGEERAIYRKETNNTFTAWGKSKNMYIDTYNYTYSRESDTVSFFVKPSSFDSGSDVNDIRAFISKVKFNGEEIDSWTKYGINDFLDVDDYGPINKIINWRDTVYFFQNTGMGMYSINPRAITSAADGVPTELGNSKGLVDHTYITTNHGSIHQWGVKETDMGIYIFDGTHRKIFKITQTAEPLSEIKGIHSFLKNMEGDFLLHKDKDGDNPILGKGMHIAKDPINNEVIFTFRGTQTTMPLTPRTSYPAGVTVTYGNPLSYATVTNEFMTGSWIPPNESLLVAQLFSPAADGGGAATQEAKGPNLKSTALVYDEIIGEFTTRFSACPTMYLENGNILLSPNPSAVVGQPSIYRHNVGNWGEFYDNPAEMSIKLVLNDNADLNKVIRTIEFNSIIRDDGKVIKRNATITAFQVETEYQDTGKILFSSGRVKRRFDKWRLKIPRDTIDTSGKDRLRSTYFMLTLYFDNEVNRQLILDRIMYYYDIQEF